MVTVFHLSVASCWCWQLPFEQYLILQDVCSLNDYIYKFEVFPFFTVISSQERQHFGWFFDCGFPFSFSSNPKHFQIKALEFCFETMLLSLEQPLIFKNIILTFMCHLHWTHDLLPKIILCMTIFILVSSCTKYYMCDPICENPT